MQTGVANSDLLIIAGARIADRAVPKPENLEQQVNIIHIDIDTAEIGKNLGPTIPLVGRYQEYFRPPAAGEYLHRHDTVDRDTPRYQEEYR